MARATADRGDSLIEVLMALMILSIGIAGLLGALSTNASTTTINRAQSATTTVLLGAAEEAKAMALPACGSSGTLDASRVPRPPAVTSVNWGPVVAAPGSACDRLREIPVVVTGDGFTLTTSVLRRP